MRKYIKLSIALAILAVLVYLLFVFDVPRAKAPERADLSFSTSTPLEMVREVSPKASSKVSSPLTISGEARGPWYFEASFPVKVIGANGAELGSGIAEAKGDWMTTGFVPFSATVTFSPKGNTSGFIRLIKDNPSGIPKLDAHVDVPVNF